MPDGQTADVSAGPLPQATLKDGTRLLFVDMGWYASAQPDDQPLSEEDRAGIAELLTVPSFYDRALLLHLVGDAQRAVGLVELVRDRDFHAGRGELIWRAEIWYFEFQNGGWAKVSQQNKLLDRQRFGSADQYRSYVSRLRFVPRVGKVSASGPTLIKLAADDLVAPVSVTTKPAQ